MTTTNNSGLHGWLILDKPLGITSAKAVGRVKRLLNVQKIGHAGTLDPLATGILPLAIGEASKTFAYATDTDKTYRFTIGWGEERETDDLEGKVIASSNHIPSEADIRAILPAFTGDVLQTPPNYSAIKLDGKRAYDLARQGEEIKLTPRKVQISQLKFLGSPDSRHTELEMTCGKGTYVRSIARDMGRKLGTYGHITALRRTQVGRFDETHAISLENLEKLGHSPPPIWPLESALDDILALSADSRFTQAIRFGRAVYLHHAPDAPEPTTAYVMHDKKVVAVGTLEGKTFKPARVFNY